MKKSSNRLTLFIFIAMLVGIGTGYAVYSIYSVPAADLLKKGVILPGGEGDTPQIFADRISILTDIFLRLVKMIIAPLVFSTLVVGVAKMGDIKAVGRIGGKTMLWFISATFVSLFLGLILVNLMKPGVSLNLPLPDTHAASGVAKADMSLKGFFHHVVPDSVIDAMAKNEILQIVIFALFFGIAAAAVGEKAQPVVKLMDSVAHIMLKVTGFVMNFAPFAVFGAMAAIIATKGLAVLMVYGKFIIQFYAGLFSLWIVLAFVGWIILGKRVFRLLGGIKDPLLLAFGTASSEAAYPRTMAELERFGCDNRIVSFVLPLGYSFNLDGSMMYMTFASLFIAQAYGMHLSIEQQITMLLVLMITSKGIAGVPRASLVVIAGTLSMFHIPEAGLLLLLGVDHLLDMGRSATNVIGNAMATAVVSKWENKLGESDVTDVLVNK
ncbi:dicarboxylate/amino acid:cation symporter [Chitinophaga flava]|uniref:Dicarboxylate/amino acid:cation symporter n=1 Tax=Chitinophaga flava TaxID=2259036 RepID=A0A365XWW1_9BACT|nr:dicarboxylate/amino acid:cation symporter [Chitinophaga flava]RBL90869.1 dicarboxylate/amino acid:cation symporter [Chitinophaga flava]